jgi:hypothetical protein
MKVLNVKTLKYYTLYNNVSEYQLLDDLNLPDPDDSPTPKGAVAQQRANVRAILAHYRSLGFTHLHDHTKNILAEL